VLLCNSPIVWNCLERYILHLVQRFRLHTYAYVKNMYKLMLVNECVHVLRAGFSTAN